MGVTQGCANPGLNAASPLGLGGYDGGVEWGIEDMVSVTELLILVVLGKGDE